MALDTRLLASVVVDRLRKRSEQALEQAKRQALAEARRFGPSQATGHPYATGAFIKSLFWRDNQLLSNVDHAPYTDGGYTRRGKGTARRWRERGGVPFGDHYAERFLTLFREAFDRAQ